MYERSKRKRRSRRRKNAIKILGGEITSSREFNLPNTEMARTIIQIEKIKNTEKKYPRKAGTPTKMPL